MTPKSDTSNFVAASTSRRIAPEPSSGPAACQTRGPPHGGGISRARSPSSRPPASPGGGSAHSSASGRRRHSPRSPTIRRRPTWMITRPHSRMRATTVSILGFAHPRIGAAAADYPRLLSRRHRRGPLRTTALALGAGTWRIRARPTAEPLAELRVDRCGACPSACIGPGSRSCLGRRKPTILRRWRFAFFDRIDEPRRGRHRG